MKFTLGVCDDNPKQVQLLKGFISGCCKTSEYHIITETNPNQFLLDCQNQTIDLVFLDVDMPEINGIELGHKMKALNPDTVIIYITAYDTYALKAFSVHAYHYLLKPLTSEDFEPVFKEAMAYIQKQHQQITKSFSFKTKKELVSLPYGDILYFEKSGHKILLHTQDQTYTFYDNFTHLLKVIDPDAFIQCHQGFIVNQDMIRGFKDKMLYLEGHIQLPVSRTYTSRVRDMLVNKLFNNH